MFAVEYDFGFEFGLSVERIVEFADLIAACFGSVEKLARTTLRHHLRTERHTLKYCQIRKGKLAKLTT